MPTFKKIYYPKMLLETLRGFAINKEQKLSVLYKICFSCLYSFQQKWNDFDNPNPSIESILKSRRSLQLIANCRWITGEVENLLNYLFDPIYERISIANTTNVPTHYANNFDDSPGIGALYLKNFDDSPAVDAQYFLNFDDVLIISNIAVINIPYFKYDNNGALTPEYTAIDAVINMVRLKGIKYIINAK